MRKFLHFLGFSTVNTYIGTISCKAGCNNGNGNAIVCNCNLKIVADSVTFNEKNELIFVNKTFNLETETEAFKSYTKTNTDMEELNPANLIDSDNKVIHIYKLKVGYSPSEYNCFKYNDKIYVLKEDQGRYLIPIVEKSNDNSFKEKIDWVCVIGSDKDEKNNKDEMNYFLLKKKFEDNKKNALILDNFISKNKFKTKKLIYKATILDEEKEKETLKQNNGTITINNIQINIGTINNINNTQNIQQDVKILNKK